MLRAMDFLRGVSARLLKTFESVPKERISMTFQDGKSVPGCFTKWSLMKSSLERTTSL